MKEFKNLTDAQQQELKNDLKDLQKIAKVYQNFGKEYHQAVQKAPQNSKDVHTYLVQNFNKIFSVDRKYGIGSGIMSLDSVQDHLNGIANSVKRLAVYPNATLHQVIDDVTTVATDFDSSYDHWLKNVNGVVQDGQCLDTDIDEIKNSFKINH